MKIVWSALALSDRDGIFTRIELHNPRAAIAMDERIVAATSRLRQFPESGRPGRVAGTRELVVGGTPYIAPYRVGDETVWILRILHAARVWPNTFNDPTA